MLAVACGSDPSSSNARAQPSAALSAQAIEVSPARAYDHSPALSSIPSATRVAAETPDRPFRLTGAHNPGGVDVGLQGTPGPAIASTPGIGFAGVGNGDYGFVPDAAPPDTDGAVGATQYVQ